MRFLGVLVSVDYGLNIFDNSQFNMMDLFTHDLCTFNVQNGLEPG